MVDSLSQNDKKERIGLLLIKFFEVDEDGSFKYSEKEQDLFFDEISILSPDPNWSDYIFHSDEFNKPCGDFDIDGFLEKIFSYNPILL